MNDILQYSDNNLIMTSEQWFEQWFKEFVSLMAFLILHILAKRLLYIFDALSCKAINVLILFEVLY